MGIGHQKPFFENQEGANRDAERDGDNRHPRVTADPAHIKAHVERGSDVEADKMHQRDGRNGGPKHLENRTELLTVYEALVRVGECSLNKDDAAGDDHDQGQPERKETAPRPVRSPPEAEPNGIENNDAAEKHQHRSRNEFRGAHPIS